MGGGYIKDHHRQKRGFAHTTSSKTIPRKADPCVTPWPGILEPLTRQGLQGDSAVVDSKARKVSELQRTGPSGRGRGAGRSGGGALRGRGQVLSSLCLSKGCCRARSTRSAVEQRVHRQTRCGSGNRGKGVLGERLDPGRASAVWRSERQGARSRVRDSENKVGDCDPGCGAMRLGL